MKAATGRAAGARTLAVHLLAAAATALVLLWCIGFRGGLAFRSRNKQQIFNIHPPLMLIGFIVIGGEAILAYRTLPSATTLSRDNRKKAHLALHAVALALGLVGLYAVFKYHAEAGIPNLYSLHAWLGIATVALYGVQWLAGFLAFFFPGVAPETRRSAIPWHAVLGILVFALAVGTAQLGFLEKMTFLQAPPLSLAKHGAARPCSSTSPPSSCSSSASPWCSPPSTSTPPDMTPSSEQSVDPAIQVNL